MTKKYHVALSFAGEDRTYVEEPLRWSPKVSMSSMTSSKSTISGVRIYTFI